MFPFAFIAADSASTPGGAKVFLGAVIALLIGYRLWRLFVRGARIRNHYSTRPAPPVIPTGYPVAAPATAYAPVGSSVAPPGFTAPPPAAPASAAPRPFDAPISPARRPAPVGDIAWFAVLLVCLGLGVWRFGSVVGIHLGSPDYSGLPVAWHTQRAADLRTEFVRGCSDNGNPEATASTCHCMFDAMAAEPQYAVVNGDDALKADLLAHQDDAQAPAFVATAITACGHEVMDRG
jgi:hypothetical protein